jgi:membrane protease subunit HflC
VFAEMQAECQRQATLCQSKGKQEAEVVRAQTDNEKEVFPAGAFPEAERLDGCEAATATRIYAEAYATDPEFHAFTSVLEAHKKPLDERTGVVQPDEGALLAHIGEKHQRDKEFAADRDPLIRPHQAWP